MPKRTTRSSCCPARKVPIERAPTTAPVPKRGVEQAVGDGAGADPELVVGEDRHQHGDRETEEREEHHGGQAAADDPVAAGHVEPVEDPPPSLFHGPMMSRAVERWRGPR